MAERKSREGARRRAKVKGKRLSKRNSLNIRYFQKGLRVWVTNPYDEGDGAYRENFAPPHLCGRPIFVPALVQSREERRVQVTTTYDPPVTVTVSAEELSPMNQVTNIHDMVSFAHLHEAALLNNVQVRFHADQIYTMAGPILLAMNPYHLVRDVNDVGIYDPIYMRKYRERVPQKTLDAMPAARREAVQLPPHVFAQADNAFVQLVGEQQSQSIVISGESGAGKTETTKQIMQYLANVSNVESVNGTDMARARGRTAGRRGSIGSSTNPFHAMDSSLIEQQILQSNPILEAFGNSKTLRNNNSSRFGKYIKICFDESRRIAGGTISVYLLEKSRVSFQLEGERNYHIFYQLLQGSSSAEKRLYRLQKLESYSYLTLSTCQQVDSIDDVTDFANLKGALSICGIDDQQQQQLFCVVAAILTLGNLQFATGDEGAHVLNSDQLGVACELLGVQPASLISALTTKETTSAGQVIVSPLTVEDAAVGNSALARSIYGKLFLWLVSKVNSSISHSMAASRDSTATLEDMLFIGILDIFGFEVFQINSFEQMCINYANEKLQEFFTDYVFKLEQQVYEEEQIDATSVNFEDNSAVLGLIDKKPMGILCLLDEACLFPRSTDASFLQKVIATHKRNEHFRKGDVKQGPAFVICHSASDVTYHVTDFLTKNRDRLAGNVEASMRASANALVAGLFQEDAEAVKRGTFVGANAFLGSKFKEDMNMLMATIRVTNPHFVRCIKPNRTKSTSHFEPQLVLHQLQYLGVLDSIRIRHSGFSYRTLFSDFYERFVIIVPTGLNPRLKLQPPAGSDMKELSRELVQVLWDLALFQNMDQDTMVQYGITKIFLRKQMIQSLEALREVKLQDMDRAAVLIQSAFRMHNAVRSRKVLNKGFLRLQAAWRGIYYRRKWLTYKWAVLTLQRFMKTWLLRRWFYRAIHAITRIQSYSRRVLQRTRWLRLRRGVRTLHALSRGFIVRQHVLQMLRAVRVLQRGARSFLARNREYWDMVRGALLMQASWRGYLLRRDRQDIVEYLGIKRDERKKDSAISYIQCAWKTVLIRRRFLALLEATMILQDWVRALQMRTRFLRVRSATRLLQRSGRGMIARMKVRGMVTINMVTDELWRLKTVREREALQLARAQCSNMAPVFHVVNTKKQSVLMSKVLDTDTLVDTSDVYPGGWTNILADLEAHLAQRGNRIEEVSVGATHTVCLDSVGKVYTWGWGDRGQLGHNKFANQSRPKVVRALFREPDVTGEAVPRDIAEKLVVRAIVCGEDHTAALSLSGRVFTWGSGSRGALGHGSFEDVARPRPVTALRRRVAQLVAGAHHTAALVQAGSVYSWGSGAQLGLGVYIGSGDQNLPCAVKALAKQRVRFLAAGYGFSLALTHSGDIFSWGNGRHGQLGHGDGRDRVVPTKVQAFMSSTTSHSRIVSLACGARHGIALSSTGRVFVWGWNRSGQLGQGDTHDRTRPVAVTRLKSRRITAVAAGWRSSIAMTVLNEVFYWGHSGGMIRRADDTPGVTDEALLWPFEVPFNFAAGRVPKSIFASSSHMLSISMLTYTQKPIADTVAAQPLLLECIEDRAGKEEESMPSTSSSTAASALGRARHSQPHAPVSTKATLPSASAADPISPERLKTMSAAQLRHLVMDLQQGQQMGSTSQFGNRQGNRTSRGLVVPRAEQMAGFLNDRNPTGSPVHRAKEKAWSSHTTAHRSQSTNPIQYELEQRSRTELLKFQTSRSATPKAFPSASRADYSRSPPERSADGALRFSKKRHAKSKATDSKEQGADQQYKQEVARWRQQREGQVGSSDLLAHFSSTLLVATSNDDIEVQDLVRPSSPHKLSKPARDLVYPQKKNLVELFRKQQATQPSKSNAAPIEHAAPGSTDSHAWSGRRLSKVGNIRRQIEQEILGGQGEVAVPPKELRKAPAQQRGRTASFMALESEVDELRRQLDAKKRGNAQLHAALPVPVAPLGPSPNAHRDHVQAVHGSRPEVVETNPLRSAGKPKRLLPSPAAAPQPKVRPERISARVLPPSGRPEVEHSLGKVAPSSASVTAVMPPNEPQSTDAPFDESISDMIARIKMKAKEDVERLWNAPDGQESPERNSAGNVERRRASLFDAAGESTVGTSEFSLDSLTRSAQHNTSR